MSVFNGALGEFMDYINACPRLDKITPAHVGATVFYKMPEVVGKITKVNRKGFEIAGTHMTANGLLPESLFIEFKYQVYNPVVVDESKVLEYARRLYAESARRDLFKALSAYALRYCEVRAMLTLSRYADSEVSRICQDVSASSELKRHAYNYSVDHFKPFWLESWDFTHVYNREDFFV